MKVVIEVLEDISDDDLQQFLSNLEGEPWFDCRITVEGR